jgi:hypothetical protein
VLPGANFDSGSIYESAPDPRKALALIKAPNPQLQTGFCQQQIGLQCNWIKDCHMEPTSALFVKIAPSSLQFSSIRAVAVNTPCGSFVLLFWGGICNTSKNNLKVVNLFCYLCGPVKCELACLTTAVCVPCFVMIKLLAHGNQMNDLQNAVLDLRLWINFFITQHMSN